MATNFKKLQEEVKITLLKDKWIVKTFSLNFDNIEVFFTIFENKVLNEKLSLKVYFNQWSKYYYFENLDLLFDFIDNFDNDEISKIIYL